MNDKIVKILVSCPRDVTEEKDEIKLICDNFNSSNHGFSNILFEVIDWRDFVGVHGIRGQEQLNNYFKDYDYYFGILWKRFGTNPGPNSDGNKFESGTEEEFEMAMSSFQKTNKPQISFFVLKYEKRLEYDETQLKKVEKFIAKHSQLNKDYFNYINSTSEFTKKIEWKINRILQSLISKPLPDIISIIEKTNPKLESSKEQYLKLSYRKCSAENNSKNGHELSTYNQNIGDLFDLIKSEKRIVLLGDAGTGKTTSLRLLVQRLKDDHYPFYPIYIEMKWFTDSRGIEGMLPINLQEIGISKVLLILDGLDEVHPTQFHLAINQIHILTNQNEHLNVIVSCRRNFYEIAPSFAPNLPNFIVYQLNNLSIPDALQYLSTQINNTNTGYLAKRLQSDGYVAIITNPFYLNLIVKYFNRNRTTKISKAKLIDEFIHERMILDKNHHNNTNYRSKSVVIKRVLSKVALSMEILSENLISEEDLLQIINEDEYELIKQFTVFRKADNEEQIWQFEHNNIQEYIAAIALSNRSLVEIIELVTYPISKNRLNPSWLNTLSFLFGLLGNDDELFVKLLAWVIKNDKEVLLKFEADKISSEIRESIFREIFDDFQSKDIWIRSNNFDESDLAKFGQSNSNIQYLINYLYRTGLSKTQKLNAFRVLCSFNLEGCSQITEIKEINLRLIKENPTDFKFIFKILSAMKETTLIDLETIQILMNELSSLKNEYIRSGLYEILEDSVYVDNYVDFFIEGLELISSTNQRGRSHITFADEGWHLNKCIIKVKSPKGLAKVINYYIQRGQNWIHFHPNQFKSILLNSSLAYRIDNDIYELILKWFLEEATNVNDEVIRFFINFFYETNTENRAFYDLFKIILKQRNWRVESAIAALMKKDYVTQVFDAYINKTLSTTSIENIYFKLKVLKNLSKEHFFLSFSPFIDLEKNLQKGQEELNLQTLKNQIDFDILFKKCELLIYIDRVFAWFQNEAINLNKIKDLTSENYNLPIAEFFPNNVLQIIRNLTPENGAVSKEEVIEILSDGEQYEFIIASFANQMISQGQVGISIEQEEWITNYCKKNIDKIDFSNAIRLGNKSEYTIEIMPSLIWALSNRFEIQHPPNKMLEMLMFDYYPFPEGMLPGIKYIQKYVQDEAILERMTSNLKNKINFFPILKKHIEFLTEYKFSQSYDAIAYEFRNCSWEKNTRIELLDVFIKNVDDFEFLKRIIFDLEPNLQIRIIDALIKDSENNDFVKAFLTMFIKVNSIDTEYFDKACAVLTSLQDMYGLEQFTIWIKEVPYDEFEDNNLNFLKKLKIIDALPFLLDLMTYVYKQNDQSGRIQTFVMAAIQNIALSSEENFRVVIPALQNFLDSNHKLYPNSKYLWMDIRDIEDRFYRGYSKALTINEISTKLRSLGY